MIYSLKRYNIFFTPELFYFFLSHEEEEKGGKERGEGIGGRWMEKGGRSGGIRERVRWKGGEGTEKAFWTLWKPLPHSNLFRCSNVIEVLYTNDDEATTSET